MKNKVIPRITRRIISICVILSIIVTGIEPWQIVKASDAVHVYTLDELRTAIANNSDIILEEDIKLSDYTFEYSEEHRRIGIYLDGKIETAYDVDDNKYYENYISENAVNYVFDITYSVYDYCGTIDGNNHIISGVCPTKGNTSCNSLFNSVIGSIMNLTIQDSFFIYSSAFGNKIQGSIEGCTIEKSYFVFSKNSGASFVSELNGTMKDCISDAHIFANQSECVGGLVEKGVEGKCIIDNCRFNGIIEGSSSKAAGILCYALTESTVNISNCINSGNISGTIAAGGILCDINYSNKNYHKIQDCINSGNVTITGKASSLCDRRYYGVGGIMAVTSSGSVNIQNCVNKGCISGIYSVGGIAGGIVFSRSIFYINSCSNEGEVYGYGEATYTGGIVGTFCVSEINEYDNLYPRISNCRNSGSISADNPLCKGMLIGYSYCSVYELNGVENCVVIRKNYTEQQLTPLFGKGVAKNVTNCFDISYHDGEVNILEKKGNSNNSDYENDIIDVGVIGDCNELRERLNLWVTNNIQEMNDEASFWSLSNNEPILDCVNQETVDLLPIPEKTNEEIDEFTHIYTRESLVKALNFGLNVMLEADIKYSDYTFEYKDEYRRIGIYYCGILHAVYDVDDNKYYEDYTSDTTIIYSFNNTQETIHANTGVFDGNGHTIYGICPSGGITGKNMSRTFIDFIDGRVKNLNFSDCYFNGYNNSGSQTILCKRMRGILENCTIVNSYIIADNKMNSNQEENKYVSCFAGQFEGEIRNCYSDAHIFANDSDTIGGLVCETYKDIGAVMFYSYPLEYKNKVSYSKFSGVIEGKADTAAGIVGKQDYFAQLTNYNSCVFNGKIEGNSKIAAGIVGEIIGKASFNMCINNGNISGEEYIGGIVGKDSSYLYQCNDINSCINNGVVMSLNDDGYAGGITGGIEQNKKIYNCINKGNVYGNDNRTGAIAGYYSFREADVENCVNCGKVNEMNEHVSLFGEYINGNVNKCYDVINYENNMEAIAYKSEAENEQLAKLIEIESIDSYIDLCERLNDWVCEKGSTYSDENISTWVYSDSGLEYEDIEWDWVMSTPTQHPTICPTATPSPTQKPIASPMSTPTQHPTICPTATPSPTQKPTASPMASPTPTSYTDTEGRIHVYTLEELRKSLIEQKDIVLEADIRLSDYTFDYNEAYRRIGIYCMGELMAAYDVDDNTYYENIISETSIEFIFDTDEYSVDTYSGILDGNGHTIYGMCPYKGLTGQLISKPLINTINGTVKNLGFSNCFMNGYNSSEEQSVLCKALEGILEGCKIDNSYIVVDYKRENDTRPLQYGASFAIFANGLIKDCESDAHIFANDSIYVGGLACGNGGSFYSGSSYECKVYGCTYSGVIEGKAEYAGGIVTLQHLDEVINDYVNCVFSGRIEGDFEKAAGITCESRGRLMIKSCINKGVVEGGIYAAGIMCNSDWKISESIISECMNEGLVTANNQREATTNTVAGGIMCGTNINWGHSGGKTYINGCVNIGNVTGGYAAGGIVGWLMESENTFDINSCLNKGLISVLKNDSYAGGIIGIIEEGNRLYNNCNAGKINGAYGCTGSISGCMKTGSKAENCINIGHENEEETMLFGRLNGGVVVDCYDVNVLEDGMKTIMYYSENTDNDSGILKEKYRIENYNELCDRLNIWVREKVKTYPREYLSTWVHSENELKYGEVDAEYLNSLQVPTPTAIPTMTPSPSSGPTLQPALEPTLQPDSSEPPISHQITQPPVLQGNNQNQSENQALTIKLTIKSYIRAGKKVILKWKKNTAFSDYSIYRSAKKKGKYMPLKNSVKAGTYTDTKVKANETWYYKIRGCIIINGKKQYGAWSEPVKAAVGMRKPEITLKKEVTPSGEKYVRMRVKKCDGQYIQVYVRTKQKRYNLVRMPNSDWRKMKSTFNFRYSVGGKKMYFRIRSYGTYNNKLIYSPYSDSEGIKL